MVIEVKLKHIDKIYHNQQGDVHALHDICLEIKEKGITSVSYTHLIASCVTSKIVVPC